MVSRRSLLGFLTTGATASLVTWFAVGEDPPVSVDVNVDDSVVPDTDTDTDTDVAGATAEDSTDPETSTPDASEKKPAWQAAEVSKLTHNRVNDSRDRYGLTAFEWHSGLADVAESYAQKMGEDGFFSHTHNGQNGADRLEAAGLDMDGWGENIIYTWWDRSLDDSERLSSTEDVAEWCVNWWLQSEPHFENITDASFDSHGVGFYKTEDGKILGVELFGS